MNISQPNFQKILNETKQSRYPGGRFLILTLVLVAFISLYATYKLGWASHDEEFNNPDLKNAAEFLTITEDNKRKTILNNDSDYVTPAKEEDRLDILILGIRGSDDEHAEKAGAFLTDTIMIFSYDKKTKKTSLVSIPRDLYVKVAKDREEKINAVYEYGLINGNSLTYTKTLFSQITGVYIDHIVLFNFTSFKQIVDDLGGVDITLDKPFTEKGQWGYEFTLPAGENHLDGQSALYYARSRFSSSDFDRAQRQQKIIMAIKKKASDLNLFTDSGRIFNLINTIRTHIRTDINLLDMPGLLSLGSEINSLEATTKRSVIDTTNLVHESRVDNIYILLPNGDNFANIKAHFKSIVK